VINMSIRRVKDYNKYWYTLGVSYKIHHITGKVTYFLRLDKFYKGGSAFEQVKRWKTTKPVFSKIMTGRGFRKTAENIRIKYKLGKCKISWNSFNKVKYIPEDSD